MCTLILVERFNKEKILNISNLLVATAIVTKTQIRSERKGINILFSCSSRQELYFLEILRNSPEHLIRVPKYNILKCFYLLNGIFSESLRWITPLYCNHQLYSKSLFRMYNIQCTLCYLILTLCNCSHL